MSLLPLRGEATSDPDEPRVVGLDGEEADEAFEVLSSATTRKVLSFLYEQPSTPAEVRDEIGTSLQNVHYHIGKLDDAGLIEAAGTGYSEKGTEMTIYAPASEALLLFAGKRSDQSMFQQLLARVFGTLFALFTATILFWYVLRQRVGELTSAGGAAGGPDGGYEVATGPGSGSSDTESAGSGGAGGGAGGGADGGGDGSGDVAALDGGGEATGTPSPTTEGGDVGIAEVTTEAAADATRTTAEATATPSTPMQTTAEETAHVMTDGGTEVATQATAGGADGLFALFTDPVVTFFLGGLFVLLVLGVFWSLNR